MRQLTPRQIEILELVRDGLTNKEIASKLEVAEASIKCHITNIHVKLNARDRTQAVVIALRRHIINLGGYDFDEEALDY
ncbi:MAG: LuxR C-terminal-related transcriptional regulator [Dehalococcoidia bacterium]|jgi:DNA-binding NarL/FixJ family response regulator